MKIKEFYSSGIKENGKIDIFIKCDNKKFQFLNCEIYGDKDYNTYDCNITLKYDIMNEEDFYKDWEKYFPIDLLTQEEREYAIKLDREFGNLSSVKYIKSVRDDFGLKSSKIYYDLYIKDINKK